MATSLYFTLVPVLGGASPPWWHLLQRGFSSSGGACAPLSNYHQSSISSPRSRNLPSLSASLSRALFCWEFGSSPFIQLSHFPVEAQIEDLRSINQISAVGWTYSLP